MNTNHTYDLKESVNRLLKDWTIEVTPGGAKKIDDFRNHLKPGTTVFITFLPGSDFEDTVEIAIRLQNEEAIRVQPFLDFGVLDTQPLVVAVSCHC